MNTCFNCGQRYNINYGALMINITDPSKEHKAQIDGFCSIKCQDEDNARLVEGNGIIEAAEKAEHDFTDINKLKLDVHAPAAAKAVTDIKQMNNMLGFNRAERSDHSNLNHDHDNNGENGDLK